MQIPLFFILLFNILDGIVIIGSGSYLVSKLMIGYHLKKMKKEVQAQFGKPPEDDIMMVSIRNFKKKYMISFYILDISLTFFFMFWMFIFYFRVTIVN